MAPSVYMTCAPARPGTITEHPVDLHLTNTLTRRKQPFVPRDEGRAGLYLCGPTVYAEPHVGNLRNVVVFDVLRRHLTASGLDVLLVRNYTDVDDKIITASGGDPLQAFVVAERWTRVYEEITSALRVLPPDVAPRATGHIPEMVALVRRLVDVGLAYQAGADVYFAVGKYPDYGRLSQRDPADLRAGERVKINPDKRDPLDFALWKGAKPGEPSWESPWGPGRPGWHLECSAMAAKYLGPGFDIHGGGEDLVFPHHENEIAQYEGATGQQFARYWLHNAFLTLGGAKIAKSEMARLTAEEAEQVRQLTSPLALLRRHSGAVLRYALLGAHYRSPLEFSEEVLADSTAAYDRLATFAVNAARALDQPVPRSETSPGRITPQIVTTGPAGSPGGPGTASRSSEPFGTDRSSALIDPWVTRFVAAMNDDLNVPAALAVLFDLVNQTNPLIKQAERDDDNARGELRGRLATFTVLAARLGFTPLADLPAAALTPPVLDLLLELRERARGQRDYATADLVRDRLDALGIRVEDRAGGPRWHLAP